MRPNRTRKLLLSVMLAGVTLVPTAAVAAPVELGGGSWDPPVQLVDNGDLRYVDVGVLRSGTAVAAWVNRDEPSYIYELLISSRSPGAA